MAAVNFLFVLSVVFFILFRKRDSQNKLTNIEMQEIPATHRVMVDNYTPRKDSPVKKTEVTLETEENAIPETVVSD